MVKMIDVVRGMSATELGKWMCDVQTSIDESGCSTCPAQHECGYKGEAFVNGFTAMLESDVDADELVYDDGVAAHEDEVDDQEAPALTLEDMI